MPAIARLARSYKVGVCMSFMVIHKFPEWSESPVLGVYKSFPRPTFPHADLRV